MNIHFYCNSKGIDLIQKFINGLSKDEQIDAYDVLKQMEDGKFDTLHIKKWRGKIFEVYFYKHNRMFFVVVEQDDIFLLHACHKQKNKTEKRDAGLVLKRVRELEE